MRRIRTGLLVILLPFISTCIPPYALWIQANSTRDHLVFRHASKRNGSSANKIALLLVTSCAGYTQDLRRIPQDTLWYARIPEFTGDARASDNAIIYGEPIPGVPDSIGPKKMGTGCYDAWIYAPPGSASVTFRVLPVGNVREFSKAERDSAWEIGARHGRAELQADVEATGQCRARYSSAGKDSAAVATVDKIVPYDTLRFAHLTCADLRRVDPTRTDPNYTSPRSGGA